MKNTVNPVVFFFAHQIATEIQNDELAERLEIHNLFESGDLVISQIKLHEGG